MRLLFRSLLALVILLDRGADLCLGVAAAIYALASMASLPFILAGRGLVSLSHRITHGAPASPASPHDNGRAP